MALVSAELLGLAEPGTEEWWEFRRGRVGGSDIAAILGLSAWQSYFSLWHLHKGAIPPQVENDGMEWGKRVEPVIVAKFQEEHPNLHVHYPVGQTFANMERSWQVASPDGLCYPDTYGHTEPVAGLEVKTDRFADEWGEPGTDEIPPAYLAQCRWYIDTFGLDVWHVALLVGGNDYREYVIHADAQDQALMRERACAFLDSIEADERPDIDAHSATYQAIRHLHPDIRDEDVEISLELARAYCDSRRLLDEVEHGANLTKSVLADALGNGRRARYLGQTIAYRTAKGDDGTPYLVAGRNLPDLSEGSAA